MGVQGNGERERTVEQWPSEHHLPLSSASSPLDCLDRKASLQAPVEAAPEPIRAPTTEPPPLGMLMHGWGLEANSTTPTHWKICTPPPAEARQPSQNQWPLIHHTSSSVGMYVGSLRRQSSLASCCTISGLLLVKIIRSLFI
ncbi:hypothetical protein AALO_G00137080 [Alosa alosa]|uniref:Uncharacterized protein n=1 Tax=Alosa alosa TaxID=278164 RepID=A0AAV6GLY5_9TELE|nr:hypothetical protein AALO_G00137080 [Alosa alosa]